MTHEKILSARLMKSVPMYIEKNYGAHAASEYLKRTGVSGEQLNDSDLWLSWEQYLAMLSELVRITGDESSAYEAGRYVSAPGVLKEAWHLLFTGLVNVKTAFKALIPVGRMYNRSADWEILDITGTSVRLRINWMEGIRTNRASCLNRQGMLASIPAMFGMPEARSSELQCQADGHDSCIEEYACKTLDGVCSRSGSRQRASSLPPQPCLYFRRFGPWPRQLRLSPFSPGLSLTTPSS